MMSQSSLNYRRVFLTRQCLYFACLIAISVWPSYAQVRVLGEIGDVIALKRFGDVEIRFVLYLCLLGLGSLVRAACGMVGQVWEATAIRAFIAEASATIYNRPEWQASKEARQACTAIIAGNGMEAVFGTVGFATQFLQQLAALLGIISGIAVVLSTQVVLYVAAGVAAGGAIAYGCNPLIARAVRARESARINLRRSAQECWPNTVPGNGLTFERWSARFQEVFRVYFERSLRFFTWSMIVQLAVATVVIAPVSWFFYQQFRAGNVGSVVVSTFVLLPRLLELVSSSIKMIAMSTSMSSVIHQLAVIRDGLKLPPIMDLRGRINWCRIRFSTDGKQATLGSVEDVLAVLTAAPATRLSLRGENGAGKSTLLACLKRELGQRAFYFQASPDLIVGNVAEDCSTGERTRKQLADIMMSHRHQFLLLDEWSAHLDPTVAAIIDEQIDAFVALGVTVVEVLHHEIMGGGGQAVMH